MVSLISNASHFPEYSVCVSSEKCCPVFTVKTVIFILFNICQWDVANPQTVVSAEYRVMALVILLEKDAESAQFPPLTEC